MESRRRLVALLKQVRETREYRTQAYTDCALPPSGELEKTEAGRAARKVLKGVGRGSFGWRLKQEEVHLDRRQGP